MSSLTAGTKVTCAFAPRREEARNETNRLASGCNIPTAPRRPLALPITAIPSEPSERPAVVSPGSVANRGECVRAHPLRHLCLHPRWPFLTNGQIPSRHSPARRPGERRLCPRRRPERHTRCSQAGPPGRGAGNGVLGHSPSGALRRQAARPGPGAHEDDGARTAQADGSDLQADRRVPGADREQGRHDPDAAAVAATYAAQARQQPAGSGALRRSSAGTV